MCRYEQALASAATVLPFDFRAALRFAEIRRDRSIREPDAIQLACATVEALLSRKPDAVELVAHEDGEDLIASLRAAPDCLADRRRDLGAALAVHVEAADFILAPAGALRSRGGILPLRTGGGRFRYRHLQSALLQDRQERPARRRRFRGGPRPARHLRPPHGGGHRAVARRRRFRLHRDARLRVGGPYFRRFRAVVSDAIRPTEIHAFGLRREAFVRDEALQENVILAGIGRNLGRPAGDGAPLVIPSSRGVGEIDETVRREAPENMVLDLESGNRAPRLPIRDEALALAGSWPGSLRDPGLNVSTGPVVPFRAADLREGEVPSILLLWINHARATRITWPIDQHEPEYVRRSGCGLLPLPNRNYVLLRRFSAEEEPRRLKAPPLARIGIRDSRGRNRKSSQLYSPARRNALGRRSLGLGGALQQPPPRYMVPRRQRQHPSERHRAARHPAHGTTVALGQRVKRLADRTEGLDALVMDLVSRPGLKEAAVEREQQMVVKEMQIFIRMTEFGMNFSLSIPASSSQFRDHFAEILNGGKEKLEPTL